MELCPSPLKMQNTHLPVEGKGGKVQRLVGDLRGFGSASCVQMAAGWQNVAVMRCHPTGKGPREEHPQTWDGAWLIGNCLT